MLVSGYKFWVLQSIYFLLTRVYVRITCAGVYDVLPCGVLIALPSNTPFARPVGEIEHFVF